MSRQHFTSREDGFRSRSALITGASRGIGAGFARELARKGCHLVLVSRSREGLERVAEALRKEGSEVTCLAADLTQVEGQRAVADYLETHPIDVLINNAGFGTYGPFERCDAGDEREELALNVEALVALCRAAIPGMLERGEGAIINMASIAALQPVAFMSLYSATKAFVLQFTLGLWAEFKERGIRLVAVCPGPVKTDFFERARLTKVVGGHDSVEHVVGRSLRALARHRPYVVPRWDEYLMTWGARLAPRGLVAAMSAKIMRPEGEEPVPVGAEEKGAERAGL